MGARSVSAVLFAVLFVPTASLSGEPLRLTHSTGKDRHPTWTSDGRSIIFESNRSGDWRLYQIDAGGGTAAQITFGPEEQLQPDVSPDGTRIAFIRGGVNTWSGKIYYSWVSVMPVEGGPITTLTPEDGVPRWHPTWSADGTAIYYTREVERDGEPNWDIYRVSASGGEETFVFDRDDDFGQAPSPGGDKLMVASKHSFDSYNLFEVSLSGPGGIEQETFESTNTAQPEYSPDGASVALVSRKILGRLELFELDLVSAHMRRLTFDAEKSAFDPLNQYPAYSPDGTRIAYTSARGGGNEDIWVLDRASLPLNDVLVVGDGFGLPGHGTVSVPVTLASSEASPALEFRLTDLPDWLTVTDVATTGRASGMTASFKDDGEAHILVYSPSRTIIPAGFGEILDLTLKLSPHAAEGDSIALSLSDIVFSDVHGAPLPLDAVGGIFYVNRLRGDINGDNLVDVGDLVRLVEIILDTGDPPSPDELAEADCNRDGALDALDIPCLLDLIYAAGPASSTFAAAAAGGSGSEFRITSDEEIRGVQFRLPAGVPLPQGTADLSPFTLSAGPSGNDQTVIAYDARGGSWRAGSRTPFRSSVAPTDVRAYGPGGRALAVTPTADGVRIGEPLPTGLVMRAPVPNPFRGSTEIRFSIDAPARVGVSVYDLRGARVASLPPQAMSAGVHSWPWDARDDRGRPLGAGVYIAVVEGGGKKAAIRITHLGR